MEAADIILTQEDLAGIEQALTKNKRSRSTIPGGAGITHRQMKGSHYPVKKTTLMKKNDTKSGKSKCINRRDFIRNSAPLGAGLMTVSFTPMKSFLHEYDLSGKMVIPFNT